MALLCGIWASVWQPVGANRTNRFGRTSTQSPAQCSNSPSGPSTWRPPAAQWKRAKICNHLFDWPPQLAHNSSILALVSPARRNVLSETGETLLVVGRTSCWQNSHLDAELGQSPKCKLFARLRWASNKRPQDAGAGLRRAEGAHHCVVTRSAGGRPWEVPLPDARRPHRQLRAAIIVPGIIMGPASVLAGA